jgi:hypothetical protein
MSQSLSGLKSLSIRLFGPRWFRFLFQEYYDLLTNSLKRQITNEISEKLTHMRFLRAIA